MLCGRLLEPLRLIQNRWLIFVQIFKINDDIPTVKEENEGIENRFRKQINPVYSEHSSLSY